MRVAFFGLLLLSVASFAKSEDVRNVTGLPAYPHLSKAVMDGVFRTDALGHWCMRFWAATSDSLPAVETWYRNVLTSASETDLTHDTTYKDYRDLSGIKLVMGIDYVAVYQVTSQAPTSIDLYRCSRLTSADFALRRGPDHATRSSAKQR